MRTRKRLPFRSQASRSWSIRAKIISLLLVPLITLVAMWALATAVTLGPGLDLLDAQNNVETVGRPVQALVAEIQAERKMSMVYLASGRKDPAALTAQRSETDARVTRLRQSAGSEDARNAATDLTSQRLTELFLSAPDPGLATEVWQAVVSADDAGETRDFALLGSNDLCVESQDPGYEIREEKVDKSPYDSEEDKSPYGHIRIPHASLLFNRESFLASV